MTAWIRCSAGPLRAHDAGPPGGDPRPRLRPARLPGRRAAGDARRRRPRLLRALEGPLRGRQLRRPGVRRRQRLVAGRAAALRRLLLRDRRRPRRDGADRRAAARDGRDRRRLPARQADRLPAGRADRRLRGRRLPALHPLDRRPLQRAAGDLHPARRGAGLPLGAATARSGAAGLAPARAPVRLHGADPPRVPAGRRRLRPLRGCSRLAGARLAAGRWRRRRCSSSPSCSRSCPGRSATSSSSTASCRSRTGGGKALYVGTYLPADGEYQRVKALLVERYLAPRPRARLGSARRRRPDAALRPRRQGATRTCRATRRSARSAKKNFYDYLGEDPVGYAAMTVRKVWRMWSAGHRRGDELDRRAGRSRS